MFHVRSGHLQRSTTSNDTHIPMKTATILFIVIGLLIYWYHQAQPTHPIKRWILDRFGYHAHPQPGTIFSNRFWGILLKFDFFPYEFRVEPTGVHIIRRKWFGLIVRRAFYPMNTVQMMTITETFGYFAHIDLHIRYNLQLIIIPVDRYFKPEEARYIFEQWQAYARLN